MKLTYHIQINKVALLLFVNSTHSIFTCILHNIAYGSNLWPPLSFKTLCYCCFQRTSIRPTPWPKYKSLHRWLSEKQKRLLWTMRVQEFSFPEWALSMQIQNWSQQDVLKNWDHVELQKQQWSRWIFLGFAFKSCF